MNHRLLMSVAAVALMAGTGLANAQAGMSREAPGGGAAQTAPSRGPAADRAAPVERSAPVNRDEATDTSKRPEAGSDIKSSQSTAPDDKVQRDNGSQRATDTTRDNMKSRTGTQANESKPGDAKADTKAAAGNTDAKGADAKSSTTTGQAGASAKISTEQRTKITTVIKEQKVQPVTNVNFNISVGTRVPRDVQFHPLPVEIVTVYPDWRGYDFILVGDQIIVVNPRSYEIVAVIDA